MTDKKTHSAPRRGGGPKAIARTVARIARRSFSKQGFAETDVITRWREIVGDELAHHSVPERLRFAKGNAGGGILHIRVDGAVALEIQHMEPVLVERINGFFGYRAVARLALTQGPLPARAAPLPRARAEVPAQQLADLDSAVATVRDEGLKQALRGLGLSTLSARDNHDSRRK